MNTTTTTTQEINFLELLCKFAHQRPALCFSDYGDRRIYQAQSREITKDLHDFCDLLNFARWKVDNLSQKIADYLTTSNDRLTFENGKLQYITGQYFPTEYRPACNRVLKSIIWREYANQKNEDGTPKYNTGDEIRKQIRQYVTRRTAKNYFN
jgi:hypothetical protein